LGSFRKTLFPQPIDRFFHVAVAFHQGTLGIHHAGPGFFAQFFYHCSGNVSHFQILSSSTLFYLETVIPAQAGIRFFPDPVRASAPFGTRQRDDEL
jgi:hypothetical protein